MNIDTNKDGYPDVNVDIDDDGKADITIDKNSDGRADENIVSITKWTPTYIVNLVDFAYGTMRIRSPQDSSRPEDKNDSSIGGVLDVNKKPFTSVAGAYTGDNHSIYLWLSILTISGIGIFILRKYYKKI